MAHNQEYSNIQIITMGIQDFLQCLSLDGVCKVITESNGTELYYIEMCRQRSDDLIHRINKLSKGEITPELKHMQTTLTDVRKIAEQALLLVDTSGKNITEKLDTHLGSGRNTVRNPDNAIYERASESTSIGVTDILGVVLSVIILVGAIGCGVAGWYAVILQISTSTILMVILIDIAITLLLIHITANAASIFVFKPRGKENTKEKRIFAASILSQVITLTNKHEYIDILKDISKLGARKNSITEVYRVYVKIELLGEFVNSNVIDGKFCGTKAGMELNERLKEIQRLTRMARGDRK